MADAAGGLNTRIEDSSNGGNDMVEMQNIKNKARVTNFFGRGISDAETLELRDRTAWNVAEDTPHQ